MVIIIGLRFVFEYRNEESASFSPFFTDSILFALLSSRSVRCFSTKVFTSEMRVSDSFSYTKPFVIISGSPRIYRPSLSIEAATITSPSSARRFLSRSTESPTSPTPLPSTKTVFVSTQKLIQQHSLHWLATKHTKLVHSSLQKILLVTISQ